MKDEQILKQAIEKAKANGWETDIVSINPGHESEFIFSHLFAKSFFGEKEIVIRRDDALVVSGGINDLGKQTSIEIQLFAWQFHLQTMVLVEDKLRYLEKYL